MAIMLELVAAAVGIVGFAAAGTLGAIAFQVVGDWVLDRIL